MQTLYEEKSNRWLKEDMLGFMNSGNMHLINHIGHSQVTFGMKMTNSDVDALSNNFPFFINTQGCYSGSFDNRNPTVYESKDSIWNIL